MSNPQPEIVCFGCGVYYIYLSNMFSLQFAFVIQTVKAFLPTLVLKSFNVYTLGCRLLGKSFEFC